MAAEDHQPTQQFEINPQIPSQDSIDSSLIHLAGWKTCSAASDITHSHTPCCGCSAASIPSSAASDFTHYNTPCCGCSAASIPSSAANISPSSNKRRSPDSTAAMTSDQIPKRPKKLFLDPLENNVRRCTTFPPFSASASADLESIVKIAETTTATTTQSLPPRPPCKSDFSDPSPIKSLSRSASSNDVNVDGISDYHQRIKWMKDYTKEMSQFLDDVLPDEPVVEEEEEDKGTEEDDSMDVIKANLVTDSEESFYVEQKGDSLILMFKCPCSKGFQILLSGDNCYYKLV